MRMSRSGHLVTLDGQIQRYQTSSLNRYDAVSLDHGAGMMRRVGVLPPAATPLTRADEVIE